jgi:formylglycine-generating enzyme required for sulfatase activity
MGLPGCPSAEVLAAYLRGAVAAEELDSVAAHVRGCAACLERLQALEDQADPLVAALRRPAGGKLFPADPDFRQAVARLETGVQPDTGADTLVASGRGRRGWVVVAAVGLLLAAGLGGLAAWHRGRGTPPAGDTTANGPPTDRAPAGLPPSGALPMSPDEAQGLQQRWAEHLGRPAVERNSLGMDLALVPPGELEVARGYKAVLTRPYDLGACEVTHGQFARFVTETGYRTEAEAGEGGRLYRTDLDREVRGRDYTWRTPGFTPVTDDQPVVQVTWNDADAFCRWLGRREARTYRLPTEAEWKWACRAGAATRYQHGDDPAGRGLDAWDRRAAPDHPRPVGRLRPNAWGLYDMLGNAAEWCRDRHSPYPAGTLTDPHGPDVGTYRLACGGSHADEVFDCDERRGLRPDLAASFLGFRVCREP